jgi:hypothetical protein
MRSATSLMNSGTISAKAGAALNKKLAVLKQTRAQNSKMAAFAGRSKDEGSTHQKAEVPNNEINNKTNQRDRIGSKPSAGGQARGGTAPKRTQIDQGAMQGKKWIPGGNVSAANPKTGNTRMKGPIAPRGGQYGGGGRNTQ